MYAIRLRISSWPVLRDRARILLGSGEDFLVDELMRRMEAMHVSVVGWQYVNDLAELPSTVTRHASSTSSRAASVFDRVYSDTQRVDWIDKLNAQLSGLTGVIASAVKKAAGAPESVASKAQNVSDYARFVPGGVGAIFQLVAVSACLVVMYAEANRGCRELRGYFDRLLTFSSLLQGTSLR